MKAFVSGIQTLNALEEAMSAEGDKLPHLANAVLKVKRALGSQTAGARDLAKEILSDPGMTAKILKLANSAYVGMGDKEIKTITSAIVILGFDQVRTLVLGLSAYNMLNNMPRKQELRKTWTRSITCAVTAQNFARRKKLKMPEELFIAGLLTDIGKTMLIQVFPEHYAEVDRLVREKDMSETNAEREVFKCTHMLAGKMIAEKWGFPEQVIKAIASHDIEGEEKRVEKTDDSFLRTVMTANEVADHLCTDRVDSEASKRKIQRLCQSTLNIDTQTLDQAISSVKDEMKDIARILDIDVEKWKREWKEAPAAPLFSAQSSEKNRIHSATKASFSAASMAAFQSGSQISTPAVPQKGLEGASKVDSSAPTQPQTVASRNDLASSSPPPKLETTMILDVNAGKGAAALAETSPQKPEPKPQTIEPSEPEGTSAPIVSKAAKTKGEEKLNFMLFVGEQAEETEYLTMFLYQTVTKLSDLLDLQYLFLLKPNKAGDKLEAFYGNGEGTEALRDRMCIEMRDERDPAAHVFLKKSCAMVNRENVQEFTRTDGDNLVKYLASPNIAAFPITPAGKVLAALVVSRKPEGAALDKEDARLLAAFARSLATVLSKKESEEDFS